MPMVGLGLFLRVEYPKVNVFTANADMGHELGSTLHGALVARGCSVDAVALINAVICVPQVLNAVVAPDPVDVVDHLLWPFPVVQHPHDSMRLELDPGAAIPHVDRDVPVDLLATRWLTCVFALEHLPSTFVCEVTHWTVSPVDLTTSQLEALSHVLNAESLLCANLLTGSISIFCQNTSPSPTPTPGAYALGWIVIG
jgi:hypothetical protein